ncbi:hypothetical protein [Pseudomonas sp. WS 5079]|uniref:hypothetical protein n=1 Tax=Pseudomonas sp. WS 5079 TaxID=2717492 RepID=UPI001553F362|nr:hypothetical protein [Pseudomonas sp. WS 5079]NMX60222.1 hypothetical protein [Pseudomonas sp. WS 5079]
MARTKNPTADAIDLPALNGEALTADQNAMATMLASHSDERDLLNQLMGQAQMSDAFAKFSVTVTASKLAYVKENKLYRALKGKKNPHGDGILSGSWEEFCNQLGRSVEHTDRDIANLRAFGEEALESMSRMGIGYREMRQYRRLPEDAQAALIEVAKTGDKEAFVDLAEEILARNAKLSQQLDDVNADYEAQGEVLAEKRKELNTVEQELNKTRKRIQFATPDEVIKDLRVEVHSLATDFELTVLGKLREGFNQMAEHGAEHGQDHRFYQADLIRQLELALATLRSDFHLPEHRENEDPVWMAKDEA